MLKFTILFGLVYAIHNYKSLFKIYKIRNKLMKHTHYRYITIMLFMQCLLFLSSCTIVEWSAKTYRQADRIPADFAVKMNDFIQTSVIYDARLEWNDIAYKIEPAQAQ